MIAVSGCATTEYAPGRQFGVHVTAASPFASVIANGDESMQEAPEDGAVKSTRTLGARMAGRIENGRVNRAAVSRGADRCAHRREHGAVANGAHAMTVGEEKIALAVDGDAGGLRRDVEFRIQRRPAVSAEAVLQSARENRARAVAVITLERGEGPCVQEIVRIDDQLRDVQAINERRNRPGRVHLADLSIPRR